MSLQDRRRVLGPADAQPLRLDSPLKLHDSKNGWFVQQSVDKTVPGSCYVELNSNVKILATVSGPKPPKSANSTFLPTAVVQSHVRLFPYSETSNTNTDTIRVPGPMDMDALQLADLLDTALPPSIRLELYPKSYIYVNIDVILAGQQAPVALQISGAAAAASITAASLALLDAGIELLDISCDTQLHEIVIAYMASLDDITAMN
ncbi:hypothetical protein CANCADRAFT_45387 [Tortispora caseinolytica NRRL Y-17796]|uniref:Exoribonuclease phosphorolytic domain-containing protein n=1 Tax=Tortispora caseinolytica NRRL Y-17796 TaxID=767744 RepID=A0A1E4TAW5_9ASCO|nr:hypothetical protein CANCADRAFT_45387 [Tortispora caseinolytica NRRL Y-17796]